MKQYVLRNRKGFLTIIALLQGLGGLAAFILIYRFVNPGINAGNVLALIPIGIISFLSLIAGIIYFVGGESLRFFTLSKLNLCLQVLQFVLSGFSFVYFYGPYLAIGFDSNYNFLFRFYLLNIHFSLGFRGAAYQYGFINLVPVFLLIILRWIERNPVAGELENAFLEEQPD